MQRPRRCRRSAIASRPAHQRASAIAIQRGASARARPRTSASAPQASDGEEHERGGGEQEAVRLPGVDEPQRADAVHVDRQECCGPQESAVARCDGRDREDGGDADQCDRGFEVAGEAVRRREQVEPEWSRMVEPVPPVRPEPGRRRGADVADPQCDEAHIAQWGRPPREPRAHGDDDHRGRDHEAQEDRPVPDAPGADPVERRRRGLRSGRGRHRSIVPTGCASPRGAPGDRGPRPCVRDRDPGPVGGDLRPYPP